MYDLLYALLGSITAGFHIFSLKFLSLNILSFPLSLLLVVVTMIISRIFIFIAMKMSNNPTIVHLILNMSVFVTFALSYFYLKVRDFNLKLFFLGILLILSGTSCIHFSYKTQ